jgi:large subunit ribosomal protein L21
MYAVILTGGKQYRVEPGQVFSCEKLGLEPNQEFVFDKVLMVSDGDKLEVGAPYLSKAKVSASVLGGFRGEKIKILKFKRRKHHMKRMGHRQDLTRVKVNNIELG